MKINMLHFNEHLAGLTDDNPAVRRKAVSELAKYTAAEWQGSPEAVSAAVGTLGSLARHRTAASEAIFRSEVTKTLGNIGIESKAVLPELLRLLEEDADAGVRTEAARALGRIGEGAKCATDALIAAIRDRDGGDKLRGEAAWALVRVSPSGPGTAAALEAAADDRSGHVGVRAAEALAKVGQEGNRAVHALVARLGDPTVRVAAAQALYRIGPAAKAAVPALLALAKDKDRLFRESVIMALQKIDPRAAAKV